jgi:hypothetical protein
VITDLAYEALSELVDMRILVDESDVNESDAAAGAAQRCAK